MADSWRPRLARRARLRYDGKSGSYVLLSPERGLLLNATAADILTRCRGELTVRAIADELAALYEGIGRDALEAEIEELLKVLGDRGLLDRTE
ncbi:MAG: pyrroloquinoline quinone biosynthesis peptide chaperone PqqD [Polyangiaceae bacterium]